GGRADRQADCGDGQSRAGAVARRCAHGYHVARDRRFELRRDCQCNELSHRHRAIPHLPRARVDRRRIAAVARHRRDKEMVMNENISRLMDGDIEASELDAVCVVLKRQDAMATWTCYHVIGDTMRGSGAPREGFASAFAKRFADEPTVLAPPRARPATIATWGWA